jgi:hypothetical protein
VVRPTDATERALQWVEAVLAHEAGVRDPALETISAFGPHLLVEIGSIRLLINDPLTKVSHSLSSSIEAHRRIRYSGRSAETRIVAPASRELPG